MAKKRGSSLMNNTGFWIFLSTIVLCVGAYYVVPEFQIVINNMIEGGFGSGNLSPDNGDYEPTPATTCSAYNLNNEFSQWMGAGNLLAIGNSCSTNGGIWRSDADEVGCSVPPAYVITCGTPLLDQLENFCENTLHAQWWCDNTYHYVGCLCNKNPPAAQEEEEEEDQDGYTCAWHEIALMNGQCGGTCPVGKSCLEVENEICQCVDPDEWITVGTIFVSGTKWSGSFGGLDGGNDKCQFAAETAGLPGTWYVLASSTTVNARDRIPDTWYHTMNGDLVANNKADLFDGSIFHAIDRDENNLLTGGINVWTGSSVAGTTDGNLQNNCHDWAWTNVGYYGGTGNSGSNAVAWISNTAVSECDMALHIYCIRVA